MVVDKLVEQLVKEDIYFIQIFRHQLVLLVEALLVDYL